MKQGVNLMKDRIHETGQDKAGRENGVVSKVRIDPEVARALGHSNVEWGPDNKPFVVTEPMPASSK